MSPIAPPTLTPRFWRAVGALILREMSTSQGRLTGGYLWAVFEPVAGILLLSVVFAISFHAPALGPSFPLFYATGLLPFVMFTETSGKLAQALNFSRPLFAFPPVGVFEALVARFALAALTQISVTVVILSVLVFRNERGLAVDFAVLGLAVALILALAFGAGVMNCLIQGFWPAWQRLWSIAMRPMFLISGVFFTFEAVPHPWRDFLWWNPLLHCVGLIRRGLYAGYDADYVSVPFVMGVALTGAVVGLAGLMRWYRDILSDL